MGYKQTTIVYARGATQELIDDDIKRALQYLRERRGEEWITIEATAKAVHETRNTDPGNEFILHETEGENWTGRRVEIHHDLDKSKGELPGLSGALNATTRDNVTELVVTHADRLVIGNSGTQNLQTAVETYCVTVHLTEQGVSIHGDTQLSETLIQSLRIMTGTEDGSNTGVSSVERHTGGRPPFGFTSEDGQLRPTSEYDTICQVLQSVRDERRSKRSAADELECTRRTITNCLERPQRYNLT